MAPSFATAVLTDPGTHGQHRLILPAELCLRFLQKADRVQREGLKSFGVFVADPRKTGYEFRPTDVAFFDPHRNRRNEPHLRVAFEAQGEYFRRHDDAGFVADPAELLRAYRRFDAAGLDIVGMFHSHRRQPANFSTIDYRLHNPAFAWHLILSYAPGGRPHLAGFHVRKPDTEIGISERDNRNGSELAYRGPEVTQLAIAVEGSTRLVRDCQNALAPAGDGKLAAARA